MLLKIARSSLGQFILGFVFEHLSFLLPVKRIYESKQLVVFHHPRPSYAIHYLIVPKQRIQSVADLDRANDNLLFEVLKVADSLTKIFIFVNWKLA